ncbi:MAG: PepSY domain-containing protein [Gammaproteobacteria bacterium]|nr:PepSY domain-containing protein [Gammaproteobacteria bacterium]
MKYSITFITTAILTLFSSSVLADRGHHGHHGGLHACLEAASAIKEGYYAKVEYLTLTEQGVETYEIEIHDKDGAVWELMCDISNGDIYEVEREVESASDPLFKKHMKVDEETAGKTALEHNPGEFEHTEYEIEANGDATYEFDIADRPGTTYKIEVDAATGEIIEVNIEKWDIGRETGE